MEKCALHHKSKSIYAYAYDNKTLHIRFKSKKGDLNSATLLYGDPYDFKSNTISGNLTTSADDWNMYEMPMILEGSDHDFDYWFVEIQPKWRRAKYAFLIKNNEATVLFGEKKIVDIHNNNQDELYNLVNFFAFPYINEGDVFKGPKWVRDTIWYQIFPERFANGDASNDPEDCRNWEMPVESPFDKYGGDLKGIIDHLDYLQELGITGIYMTPIFHAESNHKYDTIDYLNIDPQFGNTKLMKQLVDESHKRGIKVMLDVVFNHCGFYAHEFQDVIENGENSKYKDWFHIKKFPVYNEGDGLGVKKDLNYDTFSFTPRMPKLNTENRTVKGMLLDVVKYWTMKLNIDGWRLDVANEVDHQFWRDFRKLVKQINPECYILGEIWHDATPWLQGEQFDGVMNYPLYEAVLDYFAKGITNTESFIEAYNHAMLTYPKHNNEYMYNLLDSHDTARIKYVCGEDVRKMKLAYLFMMTNIGAPTIYYGDEIGMTGGQDPDCRRTMIWDEEHQDKEMLRFMKEIISLRKSSNTLSYKGSFKWHKSNGLIYERYCESERFIILMNNTDKTLEIEVPKELCGVKFTNVFKNENVILDEIYEFEPYQYWVMKGV